MSLSDSVSNGEAPVGALGQGRERGMGRKEHACRHARTHAPYRLKGCVVSVIGCNSHQEDRSNKIAAELDLLLD